MGGIAAANFAKLATTVVYRRLDTPTDRVDITSILIQGKDDEGKPMERPELVGQTIAYLNAGTGTLPVPTGLLTTTAHNPAVQSKFHAELDEVLGHDDDPIAPWVIDKGLAYLDAAINEGLMLFYAFSMGLPCITFEGGLYVLGKFFPEGTVLGVPIYAIHRDLEIWGENVEGFRPGRWFELDQAWIQEMSYPYSRGPKACVARNAAMVTLWIFIATIFHRYTFVLEEDPTKPVTTCEGVHL